MNTHKYKIGDRLILGKVNEGRDGWERYEGLEIVVTALKSMGENFYECEEISGGIWESWVVGLAPIADPDDSPVEHPKHYNSHPSGVECITIARHHNFNIGNVFKYLWRIGLKGKDAATKEQRLQEVDKAIFYLRDERARIEAE